MAVGVVQLARHLRESNISEGRGSLKHHLLEVNKREPPFFFHSVRKFDSMLEHLISIDQLIDQPIHVPTTKTAGDLTKQCLERHVKVENVEITVEIVSRYRVKGRLVKRWAQIAVPTVHIGCWSVDAPNAFPFIWLIYGRLYWFDTVNGLEVRRSISSRRARN